MRELSRFRGEFLENYSLRSKLLMTQKVQLKIERMMDGQQDLLQAETNQLDHFVEQSQKLFESKFQNLIESIKNKAKGKGVIGGKTASGSFKLSNLHLKALKR